MHNTVKHLEHEYKQKNNTLDLRFENRKRELEQEFENKEFDIEYKYKSKIRSLEKENNHLHKIIDKFYVTVEKFIDWICHKFGIGESKELIKNFMSKYKELETQEYFNEIIKNMKDIDIKDLIGKRIDLLNILNIYRMKKFYSISEDDIKKMIINYNYKLKKIEIEKMIKANGYKQIEDIIKLSWYSKIVQDLDKEDLQNVIDKYIYNVAKSIFLKNRYNIGQVISYLIMVEYQNRNIITILEGIYYKFT